MTLKVLAGGAPNGSGEHGMSLYINALGHSLLFDLGSGGELIETAKSMGVDVAGVDYAVISHGHSGHGGGLRAFLEENSRAEVFLHRYAFEKHYTSASDAEPLYIGLEEGLEDGRQIVLCSDRFFIHRGIQVFSNVPQKNPAPARGLLTERNGETLCDTFEHEQNLIIEEDGKTLLVTGCAHSGIVNILERFYSFKKRMPDVVVGGFHSLLAADGGGDGLDEAARYLKATSSKFYACRGGERYERLKAVMGDSITYLEAGAEIAV